MPETHIEAISDWQDALHRVLTVPLPRGFQGDAQYVGTDEGTSLGGFGQSSNNNYSRPSGQNVRL